LYLCLWSSFLGPRVPLVDDLSPQQPEILFTLLLLHLVVVVLAAAAGGHRYLNTKKRIRVLIEKAENAHSLINS